MSQLISKNYNLVFIFTYYGLGTKFNVRISVNFFLYSFSLALMLKKAFSLTAGRKSTVFFYSYLYVFKFWH